MTNNRIILITSILLYSLQLFCQKTSPDFIILGHINIKDTSKLRFKVTLFERKDSIINVTYTDSNRNYVLIITRYIQKNKNLTLLVEEVLAQSKIAILKKNSYCSFHSYPRPKYMNGYKTIKPIQIDSANFIRYDFNPVRICYEIRFPSVEFQENKIEMLSAYGETPDSILRCFAETLLENPHFVIELSSHADTEELEPEKIAEFRGEMIKNILVFLDINPQRLIVKSYGCKRTLVNEKEIKKQKSEEEKNRSKLLNRRVVFSVLRNDFNE